jgi:hypothetical protein
MLPLNRQRQLGQLSRLAPSEYNKISLAMRRYPQLDYGRLIARAIANTAKELEMSFKKMEKPEFPPRLWVLVGFPGSGKSTFATQMKSPLLPVDADHRFSEVVSLVQGDVYQLSPKPEDAVDPEAIYRILGENMPGSGVKTIVVDSLTTIITPMVVQAVLEADARRERNKDKSQKDKENLMAPFKDKALAMRLLQDAITRWGTDVLWIYHLQEGRDHSAEEVTRPTLSKTERARLYRSLNLELHVVEDPNGATGTSSGRRRGIEVVWARQGRSGMKLWDDTGHWTGMPEKIEQAVYGGLSQAEQARIAQSTPAIFATPEAAIDWGMKQEGAFNALRHAKHAYEKLQRENPQAGDEQLSLLWIEDVERRQAENQAAPTFKTIDDLLFRLHREFGLGESEAKAKLKELGHKSFTQAKSGQMYADVKAALTQQEFEF